MTEKQRRRFWERVLITDGCWLWQGQVDTDGYGMYITTLNNVRTIHKVHQWAFKECIGQIPIGLGVLHTCDNPPCVNPEHLWLGTQADNLADMRAKGRQVRGVAHGMARLSNETIADIRLLKQFGIRQKNIAAWLSISQTHVSNVINGHRRGQ